MTTKTLSLETVVAITGRSRRTWWRRIATGLAARSRKGLRGRTMLLLEDITSTICVALAHEDIDLLLRADAGDAEAQNDMGQFFYSAGKHACACYWFQLAAEQQHADAMQWLAHCHLAGRGIAKDENLALMWLAKAAAHGSVIAQAQMQALRNAAPLSGH